MKNLIFPLTAFVILPLAIVGVTIMDDEAEITNTAEPSVDKIITTDTWFRDNAEVYRLDEDDEVYSQELLDIYNPAVVNVRQGFVDNDLLEIEVDISGDRQERVSLYMVAEDQLRYVSKETTIYQFPKWDPKHASDISTLERLELYFDEAGGLLELRKDGLVFDCGTLDLCVDAVAKAEHDFEVYRNLQ